MVTFATSDPLLVGHPGPEKPEKVKKVVILYCIVDFRLPFGYIVRHPESGQSASLPKTPIDHDRLGAVARQ